MFDFLFLEVFGSRRNFGRAEKTEKRLPEGSSNGSHFSVGVSTFIQWWNHLFPFRIEKLSTIWLS